jgi:hypothetical protein
VHPAEAVKPIRAVPTSGQPVRPVVAPPTVDGPTDPRAPVRLTKRPQPEPTAGAAPAADDLVVGAPGHIDLGSGVDPYAAGYLPAGTPVDTGGATGDDEGNGRGDGHGAGPDREVVR